jgi:hypothetical protein
MSILLGQGKKILTSKLVQFYGVRPMIKEKVSGLRMMKRET